MAVRCNVRCAPRDQSARSFVVTHDVDDLPCKELVELVTDYIEGRMEPLERARFESHLVLCDGCRTYLEQMRQTIRALGKLTEESIDARAKERLLSVFHDWKRSSA
jgi:anti-sigma factor RsiW